MSHREQIGRYFPSWILWLGYWYARYLKARRWLRIACRRTGRRWDDLARPVHVSLTLVIDRQWTTDPIPVSPGSWRMIG